MAIPPPPRPRAVTWRALLLSLLLLPVNAYWVVQMEVVRYSAHPTTISLYFNTIFFLLVLTLINRGVGRIAPRLALERGELLLIYAALSIGSCVCGHDMLQVFVPMLTWTFQHANSTNNWDQLIHPHLNRALFIDNPAVYKGFYEGRDTLWQLPYLRAWLPVVLLWTGFITALLFVMLCLNALLRRQWTESERLTYPIIQLPLQIADESAFSRGGVFRAQPFWIAFVLAGAVDTINCLNLYYPSIPPILTPGFGESFLDVGPLVTEKPWNAIGWTPLSWYPFLIGLGMLMPLDFLFSCVLFYWLWKMERVFAAAMAWDQTSRFPYTENQAFGAYLSFCLYSIWLSRGYLLQVLRRAFGEPSTLDDSEEPISYRAAVLGILGGVAALTAFSAYLGMTWWIGILFFVMYFALALAITRMRVELGTPVHDLHFTGPEMILTRVAGSRAFDAGNLTVFALYFWFNRAYRSHPMPHQLEAFKLAEQTRTDYRRWWWALLLLGAAGTFVAFWVILHLMYDYGAEARSRVTFGAEAYDTLTTWLKLPENGKLPEMVSIGVGFGIAVLLQVLRIRFPGFVLHPLAFAVTSSWEINLVWGPLLLAWIAKWLILRYTGQRGFRRALPFFLGLMLGQFVVGSLWNIVGILADTPTYQFWQ